MSAVLLDGDALAARRFAELAERVAALSAKGVVPHLTTVLLGEDPASAAYIGRKHANCAEIGAASEDIRLSAETSQGALLELVGRLNADPARHGILVQLPLPAPLDADVIGRAIAPQNDVDGLHPLNLGRLLAGRPDLLPCTPAGILDLLQSHDVPLAGRRVTILGRGALVGRPLAMLLSLKGIDASVTLLHSQSGDMADLLREADVVISAVGQPDLVRAEMIRPGAAVVGVGISYAGGQVVSDIADDVARVAGHVTPRHGSVGAMTRAHLLGNLVTLAERSLG